MGVGCNVKGTSILRGYYDSRDVGDLQRLRRDVSDLIRKKA